MFTRLNKKWIALKSFFKDFFSEVEYVENENILRKKWDNNWYGEKQSYSRPWNQFK